MFAPYRKHFLPTWKAVLYSMNGNSPQLEKVVYAPRTSCRNDWPRRSGKLNPNSHIWIFSSVSVGSSRHSYSFTSATVRILVHTPTKSGSTPSGMWRSLSRSARRCFALLQKSHQEQKRYHVWFSCQRKSYSVNITKMASSLLNMSLSWFNACEYNMFHTAVTLGCKRIVIISADDKYIKHFFCYTFFRFPLHNRGKELAKFFYGIFLLNKNIAQVESQFKCLYGAND